MIRTLSRRVSIYAAIAAMIPKLFLAYSMWVWVELFAQTLMMFIVSAFWRAVYTNSTSLGGLNENQTINYILLALIFAPLIEARLIWRMGSLIRHGEMAMELLRPLDFQLRFFTESLAELVTDLVFKLPLVLVAWFFFGLQLPSDPRSWGAFIVSLLLGRALIFAFNWSFACLAFYSTEVWGLSVLYEGIALFFSGAMLPLAMMPAWLQAITNAMPFAQALYVPVALLSGITPVNEAPRLWLTQAIWMVALWVVSRFIFSRAIRKVTVQGG